MMLDYRVASVTLGDTMVVVVMILDIVELRKYRYFVSMASESDCFKVDGLDVSGLER